MRRSIFLAALLLSACSHKQGPHRLPAKCRPAPEVLNGPDEQRHRCAAHAYAAACSGGLREGCEGLRSTANEHPDDAEIVALARTWAP